MSKKWFAITSTSVALVLAAALAGTAAGKPATTQRSTAEITLGFSQVGAESGWRTANTKSIQAAAKAAGIDLKFSDAQQKQENQIKAIRSYIQQNVDVIAFSPVVETGWDAVLQRGQARQDPGDPHRPRRRLEGHDALQDVPRLGLRRGGQGTPASGSPTSTRTRRSRCNIVELQGTTGSAPAIDRAKGFRQMIKGEPEPQDHRLADR